MSNAGRPWPYLYHVLGAHHEAGAQEIEAAFLAALRGHEGDTGRLREVADAWAVLGDPERRAAYDRQPSSPQWAETVRPLVVWAALYVGVLVAELVMLRNVSLTAMAVLAYVAASAPAGWGLLALPLRQLRLTSWQWWWFTVPARVLVGAAVTPRRIWLASAFLVRAGQRQGPEWRARWRALRRTPTQR
jgi:hypothetical protein